jgi:hypothetical protein
MVVMLALAILAPTPVPTTACAIERTGSGSVEFVCGDGPEAPDGSRRVLLDGTDCGRLYRAGDGFLWTGCERMQRAMQVEP